MKNPILDKLPVVYTHKCRDKSFLENIQFCLLSVTEIVACAQNTWFCIKKKARNM